MSRSVCTADGVEIVVGMTVWTQKGRGLRVRSLSNSDYLAQYAPNNDVACESVEDGRRFDSDPKRLYSTRLAALRAWEREILTELTATRTVLWAEEKPIKQRIMEEGKERLRDIFGADAEFVEDWYIHEGYEHATCSVLTALSVEEAMSKLEKFDDEWWLDHSHLGMVTFDLRFEDAGRR